MAFLPTDSAILFITVLRMHGLTTILLVGCRREIAAFTTVTPVTLHPSISNLVVGNITMSIWFFSMVHKKSNTFISLKSVIQILCLTLLSNGKDHNYEVYYKILLPLHKNRHGIIDMVLVVM